MAGQLTIKQLYLKDLSFQAPMGAAAFNAPWSPRTQVDVNVETEPLGDDLHEVELRLSVVARTEPNTHYRVEVVQAGIFAVGGGDADATMRALRTAGAEILYPFAREAVESVVARGRFPALYLDPIDFAASYDAE